MNHSKLPAAAKKLFLLFTLLGLTFFISSSFLDVAVGEQQDLTQTTAFNEILISDALFLYSTSVLDFDIQDFLSAQSGPLATYSEEIDGQLWTAADTIKHNAMLYGINPQLIPVFLEIQGKTISDPHASIPEKFSNSDESSGSSSFYHYVNWLAGQMLASYDAGRYQPSGLMIEFGDGQILLASEELNPATYAVQATLARILPQQLWDSWLQGPQPLFSELFSLWFGDLTVDQDLALLAVSSIPSNYILPFTPGETWYYTGGPHNYAGGIPGCYSGSGCWRPWSAIDVAPPEIFGCPSSNYPAHRWIVAANSGNIIYSGQALIVIDHGDGWRTYYSHVATADRRGVGYVAQGEVLGHPSCEVEPGGSTTGVHVHFAIYQNGTGFLDISGSSFSGWLVSETSHYNGQMTLSGITRTATVGRHPGTNDITAGGACPQSGGLILYKHANYSCGGEGSGSGYLVRANAGFQDIIGALDDETSAVRLPAGWSVKLFEHPGGGGASICLNGDDADFTDNSFGGGGSSINDRVSSLELYNQSNCYVPPSSDFWTVTFFSDTDLNNQCGPTTTFDDTYVFENWGSEAPTPPCGTDNWSVRYSRIFDFLSGDYTFGLGSDDWSRIKINDVTVVDNWQGAGEQYGSPFIAAGTHKLTVEYADVTGPARLSAWWWGPGYSLPRDSQDSNQWFAQYWGNKELWWDPAAFVNEGQGPLNHSWGGGGPGYGLPDDQFSGRFQRELYLECGIYKFQIASDDGVRFWLNDQLLLDKWFDHIGTYDIYKSLPDGNQQLKLEYYENAGSASISLNWDQLLACPLPDPVLFFPLVQYSP